MSTSLLYHAFGVRGYRHLRTRYEEGTVVFVIEQPRENCRCSQCGSDDVHSRGTTVRRLRCVPIGGRPAFVECAVPPTVLLVVSRPASAQPGVRRSEEASHPR